MSDERQGLHLGERVDPNDGGRTGEEVRLPPGHLTRHGVIVGMTGSGKTGLGVVLLEEALLTGVPVLVLDPKGDMGNLLLSFPELQAEDFRPWVDPAEARRTGVDLDTLAASTARTWRQGLESWGIGPDRLGQLRDSAAFTLYTPGSRAGEPMNLLGSLAAAGRDWRGDEETIREEIEGIVSGLLTIAGLDADPLSSREHILLANVIEHLWREGRDLAFEDLIRFVQDPPLRKLGVFALEDFFPAKERRGFALRLNALLAAPSFTEWLEGEPLDLETLIRASDGRPTASIVYLAHLSDAERQFVVTLILTRLVTWMRQQPGTSDLRLLVYMDEMFGFAPPTASPPSKKPILTLFKQARAHGVGMVVSTQNPVDLDYKVISNAATWVLGRLQTERDRKRVLDGLSSASGTVDLGEVGDLLSGLRKREFVLRTTRSPEPVVFTTRWAMSYLRGSLTREEVTRLVAARRPGGSGEPPTDEPSGRSRQATPGPEPGPLADDETPVPPVIPDPVPVYFLDPAAPWASELGAVAGATRLEPALAARLRLTFDERHAEIDHTEEWEAVFFPLDPPFRPDEGLVVDYDDRDFRTEAPADARFVLGSAPLASRAFYRDAERALVDHVHRQRHMTVFRNPKLKLYSRPGEDRETFLERCRHAADEMADRAVADLRDRYETRLDRARDAMARAESRVRELEVDVSSRKQQEVLAGAGKLISMFLRGRASAAALSGAASRRSMTRRTEERLRTAGQRQTDREQDIEDLERELADEVAELVDAWADDAEKVESLEIGLEKNDIAVDEMALVWVPTTAR